MIGQLPETFKKKERFLRLWLKPLWAENTAALVGGGLLFSPPIAIAAGGRRLRHVDRIGGGKAVLETLFERSLELAFAGVLPLALVAARLLHDGLLRNGHGCSPCKRRKSSRHRANNARG